MFLLKIILNTKGTVIEEKFIFPWNYLKEKLILVPIDFRIIFMLK